MLQTTLVRRPGCNHAFSCAVPDYLLPSTFYTAQSNETTKLLKTFIKPLQSPRAQDLWQMGFTKNPPIELQMMEAGAAQARNRLHSTFKIAKLQQSKCPSVWLSRFYFLCCFCTVPRIRRKSTTCYRYMPGFWFKAQHAMSTPELCMMCCKTIRIEISKFIV